MHKGGNRIKIQLEVKTVKTGRIFIILSFLQLYSLVNRKKYLYILIQMVLYKNYFHKEDQHCII